MAGIGKFFSDWGLVQQGANDAAYQEEVRARNLSGLAQQERIREQDLAGRQQEGRVREQQISAGELGLAEARRQAAAGESVRSTVAGLSPQTTRADALNAMRNVYLQTGDWKAAEQARQTVDQLDDEGFSVLAKGAARGQDPKTVAERFNQLGTTQIDPASLQWQQDDKGDTWAVSARKDGKPQKFNVSQYIRLTAPKPDVHALGESGAVITGAGRPTQIIPGSGKQFAPSQKVEKIGIYDGDGTKVGEKIVDLTTNQEIASSGVPASGSGPGERSVKKALPELKEATAEVLKIPGMATRVNPTNPLDTQMTLTPQGQALMPRVEAIVMANRSVPAHTAILIAQHGTPGIDSQGNSVVKYGDKVYPLTGKRSDAPAKITTKYRRQDTGAEITAPADIAAIQAVPGTGPKVNIYPEQAAAAALKRDPRTASGRIGYRKGGKVHKQHHGL